MMDTTDYATYVTHACYFITAIWVFGGFAAFCDQIYKSLGGAEFPPIVSRVGLIVGVVALGCSWN
jgi:hypothetical protein